MAVAGGVALLAVTAGLLLPPPAPVPMTRAPLPRVAPVPTAGPAMPPPAVMPPGGAAPAAPPGVIQPTPRTDTDPTAALAQVVPQPVPLARGQRDPTAMARLDAAVPPPAAPQVAAENSPPPVPRGEPARARVGEVDLGLRLMPGSRPLPDSGRRVPDGAGGEAVALSLAVTGTLDAAVQFYRQQWLADGTPADAVQVLRPGDGQALLRALSPQGGERTVWIVQNGDGLEIVLARVRPGPSAPR